MKIAILRDYVPPEQDALDEIDNLNEADFTQDCLSQHHKVVQIPFVSDIAKVMKEIRKQKPDIIFNLVESVCKSDALSIIAVQMLETIGIPYTGNGIYAQIISANKWLAKRIMLEKKIPTPSGAFSRSKEFILKARDAHSSIGLDDSCILHFTNRKHMQAALLKKAKETGFEWIAEEYIDGREFNCAFIGPYILPPSEIKFSEEFKGHKILTYEAKWYEETDAYQQSLRNFDIEPFIASEISRVTELCKNELQLSGYARVDFRMNNDGKLFVIDINTNPCISPDAGFIAMVHKFGLSDEEAFEIILKEAIHKYQLR
jgi:D-alanine-D-alanine ligase